MDKAESWKRQGKWVLPLSFRKERRATHILILPPREICVGRLTQGTADDNQEDK